mmetsp:Transcript_8470/g.13754  ORF Transcript_8470/g.13754 Transcript_8470/m.13754 type:complete len:323 (-) Transcript_8470:662-1630(-)|eukprot:CAMPEP_0203757570 /NCGR_PEP_ID=MMETSP0098-20131031/10572_1 /ASSEMBLY_ACC=CAM_ASM_000208 /TAXON_ID=96639 /ORGANISM=" , Strain NY0313808BC1" /LENGTH=322 /DNA_ID=CAMNT_0050649791 /DNA_START=837 /DNA_END=1805 /DNA_ORIENTATION=-
MDVTRNIENYLNQNSRELVSNISELAASLPIVAATCYIVAHWVFVSIRGIESDKAHLSLITQIILGVLFMVQQIVCLILFKLAKWNVLFALAWVAVYFGIIYINGTCGAKDSVCDVENDSGLNTISSKQKYKSPGFKDLENLDTILKKKKLEPYIFNLKVFLTFLVIFSHLFEETRMPSADPIKWDAGLIAFGVGGLVVAMPTFCFAMPLFMLLSGYFTPKSVKSRGATKFLVERTKRLGIPFTLTYYVWFAYVRSTVFKAVGGVGSEEASDSPLGVDVAWFLVVLWWFSVIFVTLFGNKFSVKMAFPKLVWLYLGAAVPGV